MAPYTTSMKTFTVAATMNATPYTTYGMKMNTFTVAATMNAIVTRPSSFSRRVGHLNIGRPHAAHQNESILAAAFPRGPLLDQTGLRGQTANYCALYQFPLIRTRAPIGAVQWT